MTYDGTEGGTITRPVAQQLMLDYRNSGAFAANNNTVGILYGKDHINAILAQSGCEGIRIYYGKDGTANTDAARLILVGYDKDGNDIIDTIVDTGLPCPSHCPDPGSKI